MTFAGYLETLMDARSAETLHSVRMQQEARTAPRPQRILERAWPVAAWG